MDDQELQKLLAETMAEHSGDDADLLLDDEYDDGEDAAAAAEDEISIDDLVFTLRQIATAVIDVKDAITAQETVLKRLAEEVAELRREQQTATGQLEQRLGRQDKAVDELLEKLTATAQASQAAVSEMGEKVVAEVKQAVETAPVGVAKDRAGLARLVEETKKLAVRIDDAGAERHAEDEQETQTLTPGQMPEAEPEPPPAPAAEAPKPAEPRRASTDAKRPGMQIPSRYTAAGPQMAIPKTPPSGSDPAKAPEQRVTTPFKQGDASTRHLRNRTIAPREGESTAKIILPGRASKQADAALNGEAAPANGGPPATAAPDASAASAAPTTPADSNDRTTSSEPPRRLSATAPAASPAAADKAAARADTPRPTLRRPGAEASPPAAQEIAASAVATGETHTGEVPLHPQVSQCQKLVFNFKILISQMLKSELMPRGGKLDSAVAKLLADRSNALLREWLSLHHKQQALAQQRFEASPVGGGDAPDLFWNEEILAAYHNFRTSWFVREVLDKLASLLRKLDLKDHDHLLDDLAMEMEIGRISVKLGETIFDPKRHQPNDGQMPKGGGFYQSVVSDEVKRGYVDLVGGGVVRKTVVRLKMIAK